MKRRSILFIALLLLAALLASDWNTASVSAQSGGEYALTWYVVGGGGYMSSSDGSITLGATIGQPAVGATSGGAYSVQAGFWGGVTDDTSIYLPLITR